MRKRLLSVIMVLALIIAMAPAAFAAEDVQSDTSWYDAGNYVLTDVNDLVGLAELVNDGEDFYGDTITLGSSIDCSGAGLFPIGNENNPFNGTFNGNDYTISNASITNASGSYLSGLFGHVGSSGTVTNFNLQGITASNTNTPDGEETSTGIAVARLYGTISYVSTDNTSSVTGSYRTGGIVGDARGAVSEILYCENRATVTGGANYTGGIVGAGHDLPLLGRSGVTVTECDNYGAISGINEVGGIIGYADQASISNCDNRGTVTGTGNYGTGGILGFDVFNAIGIPFLETNHGSTISGCNNYNPVNGLRAGGILGTFGAAPGDDQPSSRINSTITNCTNSGAITGTDGKTGAIFGYQITYAHGDGDDYIDNLYVVIEDSTNTGTVNSLSVADSPISGSRFAEIN